MGSINATKTTLADFKPWNPFYQSYIDTHISKWDRDYFNEANSEGESYAEGDWTNETVYDKILKGNDVPWTNPYDDT